MNAIHAVVLTLNESVHLERCLKSIGGHVASITVIDSGSTDGTASLALSLGATVIHNPFVNYANQFNFGLDAVSGKRGWVLRIDADEVLDTDSSQSLLQAVADAGDDVDGIVVRRRIHFLGRRIRFGGIEPSWQLRLWRNGRGRCERRWMDEHIVVDSGVAQSGVILSDINLKPLTWWVAKHNSYASREAIDILNAKHRFLERDLLSSTHSSRQAVFRRFMKERFYARLPPGARALAFFIYRYIFRLGFLDGREGFYFHLLQGLWYRSLVDAKIFEIEAYAHKHNLTIIEAIRDRTDLTVTPAAPP